jgi:hypothetical protein
MRALSARALTGDRSASYLNAYEREREWREFLLSCRFADSGNG